MEFSKQPLEIDKQSWDSEKQPLEYERQPLEFEKVPVEHSIPPEYPQYIPTKKTQKRGVKPILAYAFTGIFVLYMAFGYLFPSHPNYDDEFGGGGYGDNEGGYGDNSGGLGDSGELPSGANQEVFLQFQEDFQNAASSFMEDDYIGAVEMISESFRNKYVSLGGNQLDGTNQVYQDGTFTQFDGQNVTGNKGAYLWIQEKTVYYEDDKDGTIYPEQNMVISLLRLGEKTGDSTQVTILQMNIPVNNLEYGYMYSSVSCLQAAVDDVYNSEKAVLTTFTVSQNDYDAEETIVRGNYAFYGTSVVEGELCQGVFSGEVIYRNNGIKLNENKTQMEVTAEYAEYGWLYVLNTGGILEPDSKQYVDMNDYTHGTQEFTDKWNEVEADPDAYGIWYKQGDEWPTLYLKNLSDADNAWGYYISDWSEPAFPIKDILSVWATLQQHI